jgi:hypothetical protein
MSSQRGEHCLYFSLSPSECDDRFLRQLAQADTSDPIVNPGTNWFARLVEGPTHNFTNYARFVCLYYLIFRDKTVPLQWAAKPYFTDSNEGDVRLTGNAFNHTVVSLSLESPPLRAVRRAQRSYPAWWGRRTLYDYRR